MPVRIAINPNTTPARGPKYLNPSRDVSARPANAPHASGSSADLCVGSTPPSTQSATIVVTINALTHSPLPSQKANHVVSAPCHLKCTDFISEKTWFAFWLGNGLCVSAFMVTDRKSTRLSSHRCISY